MAKDKSKTVKVVHFTALHWTEPVPEPNELKQVAREIILIYALGEDGIVYEMSGGSWLPLPINEENLREPPI